MSELLWLGLFTAAIGIGWWMGRREQLPALRRRSAAIVSYNHLLDAQSDQALQRLVEVLEVNEETFEAHLGVGRQFRQRGELEMAARVHQSLLARPELALAQRERVQLELAHDFLAAGELSRAESLLQGLAEGESAVASQAQRGLLRIYEQEREWERAIEVAGRLVTSDPAIRVACGHYHCELAERLLRRDMLEPAREQLGLALQVDPACVRANLNLARLAWQAYQSDAAIDHLLQVAGQDAAFFPEALPQLLDYTACSPARERLERFLRDALEQAGDSRGDPLVLALALVIRERHGIASGIDFLRQRLARQPSLRIIQRLLEWQAEQAAGPEVASLHEAVSALIGNTPAYCCRQCGFQARQLHWQCPTCHGWSVLRRRSNG
ncbi:hypothetical protein [Pseudomonas oryzae]|uniref:Lipopolysaccharide assembly protein B n=1 Tax=Pseudomonas oryzae TaxID=1392877 RepID=A0A1H1T2N7_9PSED|nr:hypothetical protein [Pseudomonas oryzae]SDS54246.1 Lipopolysaccharide biosynthesis regulator YciM, contains six TPR domains and a predicted metal-binding C-terminal domain [Pseudomonas oryzae]